MFPGRALRWHPTFPGKLTASLHTGTGKDSRGQLCFELGEWSRPHPDLTRPIQTGILLLPP